MKSRDLLIGAAILLAGAGAQAATKKDEKKPPTSGGAGDGLDQTSPGTGGNSTPIDPKAIADTVKAGINLYDAIAPAVGLPTVGAAIKGALSGSTAASTTTGTTAAAGSSTASGGGAGSAIAAASASAASIAVAVVVVVIVIIAIIVISVFTANMPFKRSFADMHYNSPLDFHGFEIELMRKCQQSIDMAGTFSEISISDPRLIGWGAPTVVRLAQPGQWSLSPGERLTMQYTPKNVIPTKRNPATPKPEWMGGDSPSVAILRLMKQIRAISLEYISFRCRLLNAVAHGYYPDVYDAAWGLFDEQMRNFYFEKERTSFVSWDPGDRTGRGGFAQFPLLDGQTLYSAEHPEVGQYGRPTGYAAQRWGPREWFVARDATPDESFIASPLGAQLLKSARLKALSEVMALFYLDPTVVFVWEDYARLVVQRLGLTSDMVYFPTRTDSEPWWGWCFVTQPSFFGTAVAFDVWKIRDPNNAQRPNSHLIKRAAGVPLGDKRLNASWVL